MTKLIVRNQNSSPSCKKYSAINEIESLVDRFFNSYQRYAGEEGLVNMPVELIERKDNLIMRVMIPGMKKEDIDIEVSENQVNILGECKADYDEDKDLIHRSEFCIGRFSRSLSLPQKVDHEKIKAEYKDGILTLTLPKIEDRSKNTVKVNLQ